MTKRLTGPYGKHQNKNNERYKRYSRWINIRFNHCNINDMHQPIIGSFFPSYRNCIALRKFIKYLKKKLTSTPNNI